MDWRQPVRRLGGRRLAAGDSSFSEGFGLRRVVAGVMGSGPQLDVGQDMGASTAKRSNASGQGEHRLPVAPREALVDGSVEVGFGSATDQTAV
jgi:hypothetical protein